MKLSISIDTHFTTLSCHELTSHLKSHSLPVTTTIAATTTPLFPTPSSPQPTPHHCDYHQHQNTSCLDCLRLPLELYWPITSRQAPPPRFACQRPPQPSTVVPRSGCRLSLLCTVRTAKKASCS